VHPSRYSCTQEVAKHERSVRVYVIILFYSEIVQLHAGYDFTCNQRIRKGFLKVRIETPVKFHKGFALHIQAVRSIEASPGSGDNIRV
jgi:hypothetical protein